MVLWSEIEARRKRLGFSRAEMCRRAGISESTVFKGLRNGGVPSSSIAKLLEFVLSAAETKEEEAA